MTTRVTIFAKRKGVHLLLIIITVIWLFGIVLPVFLPGSSLILYVAKQVYAPVCHQQQGRCFEVHESYFLVCARCTGIYLGWFAGLTATFVPGITRINLRSKWLLLSGLPILIDVICYNTGLYPYQKSIAFLTGIVTGGIISVFFGLSLERTG